MKCKNCGKEFAGLRTTKQYCSDACRKSYGKTHGNEKYTYTCLNCGKTYQAKQKDRDKYCSRECAYEHKTRAKTEKKKNICLICGKEFGGRGGKKYCSDECFKKMKRIKAYERSAVKRKCKWCGITFKPQYKAGTYTYCCEEHKRLADKQNRKSMNIERKHGVSLIKRQAVFERDNFTCKICGKPIKMDKSHTLGGKNPHPLAPSIDHIVPVSIAKQLGWSKERLHAVENLQAAHFVCNVARGNKMMDEIRKVHP